MLLQRRSVVLHFLPFVFFLLRFATTAVVVYQFSRIACHAAAFDCALFLLIADFVQILKESGESIAESSKTKLQAR